MLCGLCPRLLGFQKILKKQLTNLSETYKLDIRFGLMEALVLRKSLTKMMFLALAIFAFSCGSGNGDDGYGGSCGTCGSGESCSNGKCVPNCTPNCTGKECGDDGCGGSCGECGSGKTCESGHEAVRAPPRRTLPLVSRGSLTSATAASSTTLAPSAGTFFASVSGVRRPWNY